LRPYFYKYKWHIIFGSLFIVVSNIFAILPPGIIRDVMDQVFDNAENYQQLGADTSEGAAVRKSVMKLVMYNGFLLLLFAVLRGLFMFLMRQTIVVMSRHIEYDQKNNIYKKYQELDTAFFKANST